MNRLPPALRAARERARRRAALQQLVLCVPPLAALALVAGLRLGARTAAAVLALGAVLLLVSMFRRLRRFDARWLRRALEARFPELEDSLGLVLRSEEGLNDVERLQRARVLARLDALPTPELRAPWSRRALGLCLGLTLLLIGLAAWQPPQVARVPAQQQAAADSSRPRASPQPLRIATRLQVEPPDYTGLPAQRLDRLDVQVPAGSRLHWTLAIDPQPRAAELRFSDGQRLSLRREGEAWAGERVIDESVLLDLHLDGAGRSAASARLDAIPDAAPQIEVREPARTLTEHDGHAPAWRIAFEARDDYGLGAAELAVTHAHGTGENIEFRETAQTLAGQGDARSRRYETSIDLAALGYEEGDDLIARIAVRDNREPEPNLGRSPALVLRWPVAPFGEAEVALDGVVRDTLPAYFRSQRQIIIDTEALLAERASLDEQRFEKRSDRIGVDQRLLRLRYGQFLGEEVDAGGDAQGGAAHAHEPADAGDETTAFGAGGDVLDAFGHTHDDREAATLFDPATRAILKAALDQMWSAEGHLRTARPEAALPYEYKALEYIKQVQQAGRIYLARVGAELPEIDPARRLTGEMKGLAVPAQTPAAADAPRQPVVDAWTALTGQRSPDLAALATWIEDNGELPADPLALRAALQRLEADPQCASCREALRAQLWPLLPLPAAGVLPRADEEPAR